MHVKILLHFEATEKYKIPVTFAMKIVTNKFIE